MVGIARFELATFCPPDKRAKPGCAISRTLHLIYHRIIAFASAFCKKFAFFIRNAGAFSAGVHPDLLAAVENLSQLSHKKTTDGGALCAISWQICGLPASFHYAATSIF